jgi:hypothetical protein
MTMAEAPWCMEFIDTDDVTVGSFYTGMKPEQEHAVTIDGLTYRVLRVRIDYTQHQIIVTVHLS